MIGLKIIALLFVQLLIGGIYLAVMPFVIAYNYLKLVFIAVVIYYHCVKILKSGHRAEKIGIKNRYKLLKDIIGYLFRL